MCTHTPCGLHFLRFCNSSIHFIVAYVQFSVGFVFLSIIHVGRQETETIGLVVQVKLEVIFISISKYMIFCNLLQSLYFSISVLKYGNDDGHDTS